MYTIDTCLRCDRQATSLDFCEMHYQEFLTDWACDACGDINAKNDRCRCGRDSEGNLR